MVESFDAEDAANSDLNVKISILMIDRGSSQNTSHKSYSALKRFSGIILDRRCKVVTMM